MFFILHSNYRSKTASVLQADNLCIISIVEVRRSIFILPQDNYTLLPQSFLYINFPSIPKIAPRRNYGKHSMLHCCKTHTSPQLASYWNRTTVFSVYFMAGCSFGALKCLQLPNLLAALIVCYIPGRSTVVHHQSLCWTVFISSFNLKTPRNYIYINQN